MLIFCLTSHVKSDWSEVQFQLVNFVPMIPGYSSVLPISSMASIDLRLLYVPPQGRPLLRSPQQQQQQGSHVIALLLLLGGVELNPGPTFKPRTCRTQSRDIQFGTINARSAVQKSSLIQDVINSNKLDILVITETWFRPDMPDAILNGSAPCNFNIMHEFRSNGRGGGISVIYRSNISVRRLNITANHLTYERLSFKFTIGSARLNIVAVYRPPPAPTTEFYTELSDLIDEVALQSGHFVLVGDINCPGRTETEIDNKLSSLLQDYNLRQRVDSPTHISNSATSNDSLLDVVIHYINCSPVRCVSVLDVGLSDHRLVTASLCVPYIKPEVITFNTRNFKTLNRDLLIRKLSNASFIVSPSGDVDEFYSQLCNDVSAVLDEIVPMRTVTKRETPFNRSKLSDSALNLKRKRRRLERRYNKSKNETNRLLYIDACKAANNAINASRISTNLERLKLAEACPRQLWKISKELLCTSVNKGFDKLCTLSADDFQCFFCNKIVLIKDKIAVSLAQLNLQPTKSDFTPTSNWSPLFSKFSLVTPTSVFNVIQKLKNKSSSSDFIPISLLKECANFFSPSIARLANLSFHQSHFPSQLKIGSVRPLIKKSGSDINDPNSYRPITNLGTISKILEQLAIMQIRPHFIQSPNFSRNQSAYRSAHSTETALLKIVNDIRCDMESSSVSCLLSLDISAAFDTLDHKVLLSRAEEIFGISGNVLKWLQSYLTNRQSFVSIVNNGRSMTSQSALMTSGVPQGSTLGPLLFAMFVSPLGSIVEANGGSYHQYADDTQLYMRLKPKLENIDVLTNCADSVAAWFLQNGLMLNASKTEACIFGTSQRLKTVVNLKPDLKCLGEPIKFVDSVRILGVTLDSSLSMNKHVSDTVSNCNYYVRALRHIRKSLTHDAAVSIACSLVNTRLDYCNSLLHSTSANNLLRLQRVQNNLARVVLNLHRRESVKHHIYALHWLPVNERIEYKLACVTYKALYSGQPQYLSDCLVKHTPARILRSNSQYMLNTPFCSLKAAISAFTFAAPKIWNLLSDLTKSADSIEMFKSRLKTELFRRL